MKHVSWLISRYLLSTIIPYFIFSWLLLSVILFVRQASLYSDIFFSVNIPSNLIWQLTIALIPTVIAFTCPMAMLVGTIIGLTKMQGDSELVAIRASGVGNFQIAFPIAILGVLMSAFAFFVNLEGVPVAASLVRSVALQTAIKKLESPIEPGVFNTEISGYTIYVKDGDLETRRWKNIFIYSEDKEKGSARLITSLNGRIDTSGQISELVLENASVSTIPIVPGQGKYISESIGEVRFAIRTKRSELIEKLSLTQLRPEELGLQQLSDYAALADGGERMEAMILWQRRIILSITPLIFCLLGTVIVLRFNRGGRGFGIAMALVVLVSFYLLAFLGEQLARTGVISVFLSSLIPLVGSALAFLWLGFSQRLSILSSQTAFLRSLVIKLQAKTQNTQTRNLFVDLTTGLRDFDLVSNLLKNFILTFCFLSAIFFIFTAFELWRFAGTIDGGIFLLAKYLFYLMPFVYLQIAPSAAMIGTLATYVIKSRQNEIVTWTSAGQSVYRLLMPCFLMMLLLGGINWLIQENLLPRANQLQDATRNQIRNKGVPVELKGNYWIANEKRIYSFNFASDNDKVSSVYFEPRELVDETADAKTNQRRTGKDASDNETGVGHEHITMVWSNNIDSQPHNSLQPLMGFIRPSMLSVILQGAASDNEEVSQPCGLRCVKNLVVYEFANKGEKLQFVYRADQAIWENGVVRFVGPVERNTFNDGKIETTTIENGELAETLNPFAELRTKPNHLSTPQLKRQIAAADSAVEKRNLSVGLEKKATTLFLPFVMALFTAPFSLSLSRKGKAATVGYAVGLWLLFTGTVSVFEQLGLNGLLPSAVAVWSPLVIFSLFGVYLLSKVRT